MVGGEGYVPVYSDWARNPREMRRALLGPEPETMRRWLAFLRIAVGLTYLFAFASKLGSGFLTSFPKTLQALAAENSLYVADWLLKSLVIPHAHIFAWLVLGSELLLGTMLLLGLGTRVASLAAILTQVLFLLAAAGNGIVTTVVNGLFIAALLVIFGTAGGWRWSMDEMIMNRR